MSKVLFLQFGQHSIIVDSYFASETNLIINLNFAMDKSD